MTCSIWLILFYALISLIYLKSNLPILKNHIGRDRCQDLSKYLFQLCHILAEFHQQLLLFHQINGEWYFVTKTVLTNCKKNCSSDRENLLKIWGWRSRICKLFEITGTIYSNSQRSEEFLVTECFSNLFLEVSHL